MATIADAMFATGETNAPDAAPADLDLTTDLRRAIALGSEHADSSNAMVNELRWLRHRDPLRYEWANVHMDAFFLAALPAEQIEARLANESPAALVFLYIGRDRTERLNADPYITPRFHRELAVRSYLTAYAVQRLAPQISQHLRRAMGAPAS
jgi:hypothetical protein